MRRPTRSLSCLAFLTTAALLATGCTGLRAGSTGGLPAPKPPATRPPAASAPGVQAPAGSAPGSSVARAPKPGPATAAPAAGTGKTAPASAGSFAPVAALDALTKGKRASVEAIIQDARSFYQLGLSYYEKGDTVQARTNFDLAIERLTSAPGGAHGDDRIADVYADLLRDIQEVETSSYQTGNVALSQVEAPPIDVLEEIEPEITPEDAVKERALVEQGSIPGDLPIVTNDRVLAWMETYRTTLHDRFQEALTRSGRYLPMLRRIFREEGLPEDLIYMAHVESAYKPYAYSRARAKGMWQFVVGTGLRYGLKRNWWIDERSDPEMATRAAAAYLKDLHELFDDWYLAMAAYNAGEGKILRAMDRTKRTDFWSIANTSQIRRETKNYVPAILAAVIISKDPVKFGFSLQKDDPIVYDAVAVDGPTDLTVAAALANATVEDLRLLNPALARLMTPPAYPGFKIHVPHGSGDEFAAAYAALPPSGRIPWKSHTVQGGETLAAISRMYGVSVSQIQQVNALSNRTAVRAGTTLQIPTYVAPPSGGHGDLTRPASYSSGRRGRVLHKVRSGETLSSIANRYRVSISSLRKWNHLGPSEKLIRGQRIVVMSGRGRASEAPMGAPPTTRTSSLKPSTSGRAGSGSGNGGSGSATYRVKSGDTLYSIATRLSMTVDQLCRINNLSAKAPLHPGTVLRFER